MLEYAFAYAVVGGLTSGIQNGQGGHGFLSAGLGVLTGAVLGFIPNVLARVLASAAVGGTISQLTGGKFANGAISSAFTSAANAATKGGVGGPSERDSRIVGGLTSGSDENVAASVPEGFSEQYMAAVEKMRQMLVGHPDRRKTPSSATTMPIGSRRRNSAS